MVSLVDLNKNPVASAVHIEVDPRIAALLAAESGSATPIEAVPMAARRSAFKSALAAIDIPGPEMGRIGEQRVPAAGGERTARVYVPVACGGNGPHPAVLFFHGGGWVQGDLDTHDSLCREVAHRSCRIVVSLDYRLAPEHPFPAAFDDCLAAWRWLASGSAVPGVDVENIAIMGDSAGGNLAAAVTGELLARGEQLPACQVLLYPVLDCAATTESRQRFARGYWLDTLASVTASYLPKSADMLDARASPLRRPSLQGVPPTLVVVAGADPLRDEGRDYARRAQQQGVQAKLVEFETMIHGFLALRSIVPDIAESCLDQLASFLQSAAQAPCRVDHRKGSHV